ncbi:MAG: HIRAN domain-containing protein [Prevotella sp.]|nr:HIRAN domain-containing protein [Prevotella sp.]
MREIIFMAIVVLFAWSIAVSGRKKKVGFQAPSEPSRPPLTDAEREAVRQAEEAFDTETSDAIHDGTYAGPLPERVDGGRWSDLYPDIYRTSIARIAFRRNIKDLAWLYFDCRLEADPNNRKDPDAIRIVHAQDGRKIGYIPHDEIDDVRLFVNGQLPYPCRAHVIQVDEDDYDYYDDDDDDYDYDLDSNFHRTHTFMVGRIIINKPQSHLTLN